MSVLLDYAASTDPFPLESSPSTGPLVTCVLTITASNPAPDPVKSPVTIEGVQVTLPLGDSGAALTDDPASIGAVAPAGWKLQPGTDAGVYAFVPTAGSAVVADVSLEFAFNDVQVNRQPGTVERLLVAEGSGGCQPPDCPVDDLSGAVTKFPAGWGSVQFWVDPPNIPKGDPTTLHWSGPEGATYTIEYAADNKVVNVPAPGQPALANTGEWPGQGDPPLTPGESTVFTLTVTDTIAGTNYTAQEQKQVTVQPPPPSITQFTGAVSYDAAGTCWLTFHWQTDADHCELTDAEYLLPASSDPEGLAIALKNPAAETFTLTAISQQEQQTTSNLELQWGAASQLTGIAGDTIIPAVSSDGSLLYVAAGDTVTVYPVQADPATPLQALRSGHINPGGGDGFRAVAVVPNQLPHVLATLVEDDAGFHIQPMIDNPASGGPVAAGTTTTVYPEPGREDRLAIAPANTPLYYADGDDGTVTAFDLRPGFGAPLNQLGSVRVGNDAVGLGVAADGSVYVASIVSILSFAPGTNPILTQTGAHQLVQGWDGNEMSDCAVAGDVVFVLATNYVIPVDRHSLQQLRDPIGMAADTLAVSPDGMRVYAASWGSKTLWVFAPSSLTGGVPARDPAT
jgi:hypothetical protein